MQYRSALLSSIPNLCNTLAIMAFASVLLCTLTIRVCPSSPKTLTQVYQRKDVNKDIDNDIWLRITCFTFSMDIIPPSKDFRYKMIRSCTL